jgi:hypothetical protein
MVLHIDKNPHNLVTLVVTRIAQGYQIFLGTKYQNGEKYTKLPRTIPKMSIKYNKRP